MYLAYDSNDFGSSQLLSFAIQSDGTLAQTGAVPIDVNPERIAIDPRGRFLYTSTSVTSKLWGFSISGTDGTLTPVPNSPVVVSHPVPMAGKEPTPINMLIDPAGQRLFAVDNINFVIDVFSIDQNTGAFTPLGTSNPQPPFELFAPVMDPQGRFLYIAAFNTDLITGVSIAGGGASLPTLPGMPVTTSGAPNWSTATDPSGSFLYSVEDDAVGDVGFLNGYRIQADGALTVLPGTPVKLAQTPFWIVAAH